MTEKLQSTFRAYREIARSDVLGRPAFLGLLYFLATLCCGLFVCVQESLQDLRGPSLIVLPHQKQDPVGARKQFSSEFTRDRAGSAFSLKQVAGEVHLKSRLQASQDSNGHEADVRPGKVVEEVAAPVEAEPHSPCILSHRHGIRSGTPDSGACNPP